MFCYPADIAVEVSGWRSSPPTGLRMQEAFCGLLPDVDVEGELSRLSGRSRSYVHWHLSHEAVVPACLLVAAMKTAAKHIDAASSRAS
jgi:hypothetical protein